MRYRHATFAALMAAPLVAVASCSVGDLDLTGKQCPCAEGYTCIEATNVCMPGSAAEGGGPIDPDGGMPSDAPVEPERNPNALIEITGLQPTWVTPAMVRWEWKVSGKASDFDSYTFISSATQAGLDNGLRSVTGRLQRPELAAFDTRGGAEAGTVTVWTLAALDGPSSMQVARVEVLGKNGQVDRSADVSVTSPPGAPVNRSLFEGVDDPTISGAPAEFAFRPGVKGYVFRTACADPAVSCSKQAALVGKPLADLSAGFASDNDLDAVDFPRAYLEVLFAAPVSGSVAETSLDSAVALELGNGACAGAGLDCRFAFRGWTHSADPAQRTAMLQVPLSRLLNEAGKPLAFADIRNRQFLVHSLIFSGTWKSGAELQVTRARIRW